MYKVVFWCNGVNRLKGAVLREHSAGRRTFVDIIFEDGRWFNNVPCGALKMNVNWVESSEFVDNIIVNNWQDKSCDRSNYIFSSIVTFEAGDLISGFRVIRKAPLVFAKDLASAISAIKDYYGVDKVMDITELKLSDCQLSPFRHDIISAT